MACMPICNNYGDVIGVAQVVNKKGGKEIFFTDKELKVYKITIFDRPSEAILIFEIIFNFQSLKRYLTFCGIGLQNAQLFEVSILEYKKNQVFYLRELLNGVTSGNLKREVYFLSSCFYPWPEICSRTN